MRAGELYWVEFPAGAGRAQSGRRPAVVFQAASATDRLPTVLLIPLTSQLDALRFPGTILIEPDGENQLRRASVALVFQIAAIDKQYIRDRIGFVSPETLKLIRDALVEVTEFDGSEPSQVDA